MAQTLEQEGKAKEVSSSPKRYFHCVTSHLKQILLTSYIKLGKFSSSSSPLYFKTPWFSGFHVNETIKRH